MKHTNGIIHVKQVKSLYDDLGKYNPKLIIDFRTDYDNNARVVAEVNQGEHHWFPLKDSMLDNNGIYRLLTTLKRFREVNTLVVVICSLHDVLNYIEALSSIFHDKKELSEEELNVLKCYYNDKYEINKILNFLHYE